MAPDPVPHTNEPMIVGPDGFVSARDDACFTLHSYLNETLRRQAEDPSHAHAIAAADVKRLRKELSGPQLIALVMAAFDRAAWIGEHGHEIAESLEWGRRVAAILYHL
jgi:hypothetical protein